VVEAVAGHAAPHLVHPPLLESVVRLRVREAGRVTFLDGREATGLRLGPGGAVAGIEFTARAAARADAAGNSEAGAERPAAEELAADLVVDAAGRRSRLPEWLAGLGLNAPAESIVDPFVGYATRLVRLAPHRPVDFNGLYIQLAPPRHTRGGIMFPIEDGQWVVTLLGADRDYRPSTTMASWNSPAACEAPGCTRQSGMPSRPPHCSGTGTPPTTAATTSACQRCRPVCSRSATVCVRSTRSTARV
jgi:hypothetical protein